MKKAFKQIHSGVTLVTLVAVLCACQPVPTPTARPQATLKVTTTATNKPQHLSVTPAPTIVPITLKTIVPLTRLGKGNVLDIIIDSAAFIRLYQND